MFPYERLQSSAWPLHTIALEHFIRVSDDKVHNIANLFLCKGNRAPLIGASNRRGKMSNKDKSMVVCSTVMRPEVHNEHRRPFMRKRIVLLCIGHSMQNGRKSQIYMVLFILSLSTTKTTGKGNNSVEIFEEANTLCVSVIHSETKGRC